MTPAREIRKLLGLAPGGHLPPEGVREKVVGGRLVRVLSEKDALEKRPRSRRPHRVEEACIVCGDWFPAGRLPQHEKVHKHFRPENGRWAD